MPAQREEIAPHDVGGAGGDNRVLVGLPGVGALAEEPFELLGGPEETEIEPVRLELLQDRGIPVQVEFPDPVVGDGQGTCAGITTEVEVLPLDRDQMLAVCLDDMQWEIQAAGLLDGLVPSDDDAMSIDKHGTAGTVGFEGPCQSGDAALGTEVGVAWVGAKICDVLNGRWDFLF